MKVNKAKGRVVIETQLSTSTSFISNNIEENLEIGSSLENWCWLFWFGNVRFLLGGNGSENFEIDDSGTISLKQNWIMNQNFIQSLSFYFFRRKIYNQQARL